MQNKYIESNELNPHRNAYSPYLAAVPFKQAIYARLGRHNCAVIAFSPAPSSAVAAKTPAELLQIGRVLLISLICCFDRGARTREQPSWKFFTSRHAPLVIWMHITT